MRDSASNTPIQPEMAGMIAFPDHEAVKQAVNPRKDRLQKVLPDGLHPDEDKDNQPPRL